MTIIINPGTEPIEGANVGEAALNMSHFLADLKLDHFGTIDLVRLPNKDRIGRFGFLIYHGTRCHEILMPGWPLEEVRYMELPEQDVWRFPRLYVDGSSWLWCFALDIARDWQEPSELRDEGSKWAGENL